MYDEVCEDIAGEGKIFRALCIMTIELYLFCYKTVHLEALKYF